MLIDMTVKLLKKLVRINLRSTPKNMISKIKRIKKCSLIFMGFWL
jgi:hypothetical protein